MAASHTKGSSVSDITFSLSASRKGVLQLKEVCLPGRGCTPSLRVNPQAMGLETKTGSPTGIRDILRAITNSTSAPVVEKMRLLVRGRRS